MAEASNTRNSETAQTLDSLAALKQNEEELKAQVDIQSLELAKRHISELMAKLQKEQHKSSQNLKQLKAKHTAELDKQKK